MKRASILFVIATFGLFGQTTAPAKPQATTPAKPQAPKTKPAPAGAAPVKTEPEHAPAGAAGRSAPMPGN